MLEKKLRKHESVSCVLIFSLSTEVCKIHTLLSSLTNLHCNNKDSQVIHSEFSTLIETTTQHFPMHICFSVLFCNCNALQKPSHSRMQHLVNAKQQSQHLYHIIMIMLSMLNIHKHARLIYVGLPWSTFICWSCERKIGKKIFWTFIIVLGENILYGTLNG